MCNSAGRADGHPCPVWVKEIVTTPLLTLIQPRVIRTWVGQSAAGEPLTEAAPVDTTVGVALVVASAAEPEPEPAADGAATAAREPAAISNPAANTATDRWSAGRHDADAIVII